MKNRNKQRRRGRSHSRVWHIRKRKSEKIKRRQRRLLERKKYLQFAAEYKNRCEAGNYLNVDPRKLGRWEKQFCQEIPPDPGRPDEPLPPATRRLLLEHLNMHGPNTNLLCRIFPGYSRRSLDEFTARWRAVREYFSSFTTLEWQYPGKVWAMDFIEQTVDSDCHYILNIRDLSSGKILAARPTPTKKAKQVLDILREMFQIHKPPLAIKSDNGSEFTAICIQSYLENAGVVQLFSPAYFPSYNGSCEAGGGALKTRAFTVAAHLGTPGILTRDTVEAGRLSGNSAPRRKRMTPDEEWDQREEIRTEERQRFLDLVRNKQAEVVKEMEYCLKKAEEDSATETGKRRKEIDQRRKCERIGIERSLASAGILLVRRGRFPQLKKSK